MDAARALTLAAGFMTADTVVTFGLVAGVGALGALGGWRGRLVPTFYRYNALALAGFGLVAWERRAGVTGLAAAATGLVALSFAWCVTVQRQEALVATICALTSALDARDPHTRGHSDRVAAYSVATADHLGWGRRQRRELQFPAHLLDVGKIGVPDAVLLKPGRFTPEERTVMEGHALRSWEIVRNVPDLRRIADVLRQHHERLDGSGYPDGVAGAAVTPGARILAVADVYDALTSDRPYRAGLPRDTALVELLRGMGTQFDPDVVRTLETLAMADRLEGALRYSYCLTH
jgi:HD-GYP domain-containing protein (c-di-GMP phosphodiesterase class II)